MENKTKIACCNICTLSQAMKTCPICPFNPGKLNLKPEEKTEVLRTELLKDSNK